MSTIVNRATLIQRLLRDWADTLHNGDLASVEYLLCHGFKGYNNFSNAEIIKAVEDAGLVYDDEIFADDLVDRE